MTASFDTELYRVGKIYILKRQLITHELCCFAEMLTKLPSIETQAFLHVRNQVGNVSACVQVRAEIISQR